MFCCLPVTDSKWNESGFDHFSIFETVLGTSAMAGQLLEFETEMFLSLFGCDGLLVVAEGLGIDRVLLQFMQVYSEKDSLVLLLNTTTPEQVRTKTCSSCSMCLRLGPIF